MAKKAAAPKVVNQGHIEDAMAKAVADGDVVNFRLLFAPFSPARVDSTERFETEKYRHLLPDADQKKTSDFEAALAAVKQPETWAHIEQELAAKRPPQLPSALLLPLADNAVRHGRYTAASQAYELLRIRRKMQAEFFNEGDAAIAAGDMKTAVKAYQIAVGLGYDYAAFPEPMPAVPDYQKRALMLHGEYPKQAEDCVALLEPESFISTALDYLLCDSEAAGRLANVALEKRVDFLKELVITRDPDWHEFVGRYREACERFQEYGKRIRELTGGSAALEREVANQLGEDPREIMGVLLGRTIEDGVWWQYLKELAYEHPAGILFLARNVIGETEVLVPRQRAGSPAVEALGLTYKDAAPAAAEG